MSAPASSPGPIAILGLGNMGEAIIRGLARGPAASGARRGLIGFDPSPGRRAALADVAELRVAPSAIDAMSQADIVMLAVKPQVMTALLGEIRPASAGRLVVSIAAGITTGFLERGLPGARVVRAMPNTPLLVGKGVVGICPGLTASAEDVALAKSLFPGAVLLDVPAGLMDATTAVSGSGPAYFFAFVEALAAAAEAEGFDGETAYRLAAGTFTGAAALLKGSAENAGELRRRVTSPGGTTAAALEVFAERDLSGTVRAAVAAATRRGRELSEATTK